MDVQMLFWIAPISALLSLVFAYMFYSEISSCESGGERPKEISGWLSEAVSAFLKEQFRVTSFFFISVFVLLVVLVFLKLSSPWTPLAFIIGGLCSAFASYCGTKAAVGAIDKTIASAGKSLSATLNMSLKGGAVSGFMTSGIVLTEISAWWLFLNWVLLKKEETFKNSIFALNDITEMSTVLLTFVFGACCHNIIARISGGIYRAASGAALEHSAGSDQQIMSEDQKNPAVVTKHAGKIIEGITLSSLDFYDSQLIAILAATSLGATAYSSFELKLQISAIMLPIILAGFGTLFSLLGIHLISASEETTPRELMSSFARGIYIAAILFIISSLVIVLFMNHFKIFAAILAGLFAGLFINWSTEYFISTDFEPAKNISQQFAHGTSGSISESISAAISSVSFPFATMAIAFLASFLATGGFDDPVTGFYGVAIAACSMLSISAVSHSVKSFAPIAEVSWEIGKALHLQPDAKKRLATIDLLGSFSFNHIKGFLTGASAFAALAAVFAYSEQLRQALLRIADPSKLQNLDHYFFLEGKLIPVSFAKMQHFIANYDINIGNPNLIIGLLLGAMLVYMYISMNLKTSGKSAAVLTEEVKRQYRENSALAKGEPDSKADYSICSSVLTREINRETSTTIITLFIVPMFIGLFLGVAGTAGFLLGAIITGMGLSIFSNTLGGVIENAYKFLDSSQSGDKPGESQKTALIAAGSTESLKLSAGSSINGLIKFISLVAIVCSGLTVSFSSTIQSAFGLNPFELRQKEKAERLIAEEQLAYPDRNKPLKNAEEGYFDDDNDPLMTSDDAILPEDEEGLWGESLATDTPDMPESTETSAATQETPASGTAKPSDTAVKTGGFEGLDDKKTDTSVKTGGFEGLDEKTDKKPVTSGTSGGFESLDETPAKTETQTKTGGFDSLDETPPAKSETPAKTGGFDSLDETPPAKSETPAKTGGLDSIDKTQPVKPEENATKSEAIVNPVKTSSETVSTEKPASEAIPPNNTATAASVVEKPTEKPSENASSSKTSEKPSSNGNATTTSSFDNGGFDDL
ncbi:MAG: sodium/proton-translocating pyrophosphatase [Candidatus Riflebacteria bacterium]|nr:sodium/proton-translocating pyrophosphatase [Candidatus Riflebacteria bacterium]